MDSLLPEPYIEVFEPMCQNAPKSSIKDVRDTFELETGMKIDDVFSEFRDEPIASASLA